MKKGYFYNQYPDEVFTDWNYVWYLGIVGRTRDTQFKTRWSINNYEHNLRKGVIFVPQKEEINNMVNIVASKHLELLEEINVGLKESNAPIIIDYTLASKDKQFSYDELYAYIGNIEDHWLPLIHGKKPLLRASATTWESWLKNNDNIGYLLDIVEPLVVQWTSSEKPKSLYNFSMPKWWEYSTDNYKCMGKIAHDETANWDESPNLVIINDEIDVENPIDDPHDAEDPIDDLIIDEIKEESFEAFELITFKIFGKRFRIFIEDI